MADNRIEVRQGENEWEARIWDNGQLLCPFTPTPFMLHCPRARVENSLKEINPNHTIVFMERKVMGKRDIHYKTIPST